MGVQAAVIGIDKIPKKHMRCLCLGIHTHQVDDTAISAESEHDAIYIAALERIMEHSREDIVDHKRGAMMHLACFMPMLTIRAGDDDTTDHSVMERMDDVYDRLGPANLGEQTPESLSFDRDDVKFTYYCRIRLKVCLQ